MTFALRAFSLAFLSWHAGRLFPGLAEPWFLVLAALAGLTGGVLLRRVRAALALPAGAAVFLLAQTVLSGLPAWSAGTAPSLLDGLPLWADRQLLFSVLPFGLAWLEGWLFTDRPSLRAWERVVHAAAAVLVFWSQGPYNVTLYPHPLALALVFGLFLAAELALLAGRPPRSLPKVAALLVLVAGLGLLWSLLGRYEDQSTASGGGLMKPDLFQFDFAPLVRLEDQITLGENLVLLYREEGTPRVRYLRRMVLEDYGPQGFSVVGKPPAVGRRAQTLVPEGTLGRNEVRQEYYLVNLDPSSFLSLNAPTAVLPYAQWNKSSFVNAYRVDSLVAGEEFWLYNEQEGDGLSAAQREIATRGGDPEIRALAEAVTKGASTPYEKATAIELFLREHYFYSLKPGPPGSRGALKHFLFEGKKGYCSYFAFSMALMLRSLGVPSRVAVGFATNPADAVLGFTPVRAFQAHAWVEVPFGPYGWIEFDPTSDTPAPGEPFQFPRSADSQALSKLIAEILEARPRALQAEPETAAPRSLWEGVWDTGLSWAPFALVLLLVAANEGWRQRWFWARLWADERRRSALWWAELVHRARRAGKGPAAGETPEAWAQRLRAEYPDLLGLAAEASRARYAAHPPQTPFFSSQCRQLGRRFDRRRHPVHRFASILFPWWPA